MKSVLFLLFSLAPLAASAQSEAIVEQVGNGQMATLTQLTTEQMAGINRVVLVQNNGDGFGQNLVLLEQSGGAMAEILQSGSLNRLVGLDGVSAALSLDGSELFLMQTGTSNTALVQQSGSAYASITQTGTGNVATVSQTGGVIIQ